MNHIPVSLSPSFSFGKYLIFLFIILILNINSVVAQSAMISPKSIKTPDRIKKIIRGNISTTSAIDFDGDQKTDFIVFVRNNQPKNSDIIGTEIWVSSDFKIIKRTPKYNAGADFKWFINLDNDPIPELITAFGYEDGIEYSIYKQNLNSNKNKLLLLFSPLIESTENNKYHWGFPWYITDIRARLNGNKYEMLCSFNHSEEGDFHVIDIPKWQRNIPVIFFKGKVPQSSGTNDTVRSRKWMNLETITKKVRAE